MKRGLKKAVACFVMLLMVSSVFFANMPSVNAAGEYEGKIIILHTNDVHGAIAGYAKLKALKDDYETKGAKVVLADAGDYSQGDVYVSDSRGAKAVDLMNAVGYDVATIGNHEFDYGYNQLKTNLSNASFTPLCSDVFDLSNNTIYDPYKIIEKDGVKIGFLGLETPEAQTKANPTLIQGLKFLTNSSTPKLYDNVNSDINKMKNDGADLIVVLAHFGVDSESAPYTSNDLLSNTTGIDYIIDGHSHTVMSEDKIQSTGSKFANIGFIKIDKTSKQIEEHKNIDVSTLTQEDTGVKNLANSIKADVDAKYDKKFATSQVDLVGDKAADPEKGIPYGNRDHETNNGDLITDAMKWTIEKDPKSISVPTSDLVAVTNGGGIRAAIKKGDVTMKDIKTVLPFGNSITVVYVKGSELLEALEASTYCTPTTVGGFPQVAGIKYSVDTTKSFDEGPFYPGSTYHKPASIKRVTINYVNGQPFDKNKTYAVATNDFCAGGGDTYYAFASATKQLDSGILLDEAVVDFVKNKLGGVIGTEYADTQNRISIHSDKCSGKTILLDKENAVLNQDSIEGDLCCETCKMIIRTLSVNRNTEKEKNNFGHGTILTPLKDLFNLVFTDEIEKQGMSGVDIWTEMKDVSKKVSDKDKKAIDSKLPKDYKVGLYLDINLLKQLVDDDDASKISEVPGGDVELQFELPSDLVKDGRQYKIIRLHGDETSVLDTSANGKLLSFKSNKFSTYAVAYYDNKSVNTGDNNINIILTLLLIFSISGVVLYRSKKHC